MTNLIIRKLRLRSYSIQKVKMTPYFRIKKKKINGIVNKRRVVITLNEAYKFLESGQRPETKGLCKHNQVLNEIEYHLSKNTITS